MRDSGFFFTANSNPASQALLDELVKRWGQASLSQAQVIVAIGGDGFMLRVIRSCVDAGCFLPIYGINKGSVGFLMNVYDPDRGLEPVVHATRVDLNPLRMTAVDTSGKLHRALGFNEISLFRQTHQIAKIRICVDGKVRLDELACDGALVATPAGSTAYNFSAYGPILPLNANLLALTAIGAFRPRRWHGALLPNTSRIVFEVLENRERPVSAVADFLEVRNVRSVEVSIDTGCAVPLLFDPSYPLENRIADEQFFQS